MTLSYSLFSALMTAALAVNICALILAVSFLNRHKRADQTLMNPFDGLGLWMRLVVRGSFGAEAEPGRRRVIRTYLLSFALFGAAIALAIVFPIRPA